MTQEEEAKLRARHIDLSRYLRSLSYQRSVLQGMLEVLSVEYLAGFKEKEQIERQLTKVKIFAASKEPQKRVQIRKTKMEKLVQNLTPAEVVKLLARMKEER